MNSLRILFLIKFVKLDENYEKIQIMWLFLQMINVHLWIMWESGAMYYVYGHGLVENTVIVAALSEWQPHSFVIAAFGRLEQLGRKQYYAAEISNGFLVEMYIVEQVMNNVCFISFFIKKLKILENIRKSFICEVIDPRPEIESTNTLQVGHG